MSIQPTFLDLFCGCGGFALGMERAGFRCLAAIDFNAEAIATFAANFPADTLALRKDLTTFTPAKLAAKLGAESVDVIVGGPPCQGFSNVRQVDAANHGSRVLKDGRRWLFRSYLAYAVGEEVKAFLAQAARTALHALQIELPPRTCSTRPRPRHAAAGARDLPHDLPEANDRLRLLAQCTRRELRALDPAAFRSRWHCELEFTGNPMLN